MQRTYILIALILIIVFFAYYQTLTVYFSQDDFFHFKVSQTDGSFFGFLKLFGFYPFAVKGIAFYRPIFREVLYNSFYLVFGLNPLPFRVLALSLHLVNTFLVYLFIRKVTKNRFVPLFTSLFFGLSSANVALLYYLAGGIEAIGATLFMLVTLLLFDRHYWLSFIAFVLGLASHELAVVTPLLIFGLLYIDKHQMSLLKIVKSLLPFILFTGIYLILEISVIGLSPGEKQYQTVFNAKTTLNTLMWYVLWAIGLPEMLIDFIGSGFDLKPQLLRFWGSYFKIIFPTFALAIFFIAASVFKAFTKPSIFKDKKTYLFIIWFPFCIIPVIFLPSHKSTYYLAPALVGIWAFIGLLSYNFYQKIKKQKIIANLLLTFFIIDLVVLSFASIRLGDATYWAATRGRLAEKILTEIKARYPTLPKGAYIYFENDPNYPYVANDWGGSSRQVAYVLNYNLALQLLYQDFTIQACFQDLSTNPDDCKEKADFVITAKI